MMHRLQHLCFRVPFLGGDGNFDGDGDLDVFVGVPAGAPHHVWRSRLRQLDWRATPRIGKDLVQDVSGPAPTLWMLGSTFGTDAIPTNNGLLRLSPLTLAIEDEGVLDLRGEGEITWSIPNDPARTGVVLYTQAAVGAPLRLTNLVRTTLTNL